MKEVQGARCEVRGVEEPRRNPVGDDVRSLCSPACQNNNGTPNVVFYSPRTWQLAVRIGSVMLGTFLALQAHAGPKSLSKADLVQIRFDQRLNSHVSPTLTFRDEEGRQVRLGQYFGQKPVVLVLGYYECPMLCTLVLNGLVQSLQDVKWSIGREFEVVDVSINPREGPALAAAKKQGYLKSYGRTGAASGWHFLTGGEPQIRQLAQEVGFRYAYDPVSGQFAHPSGVMLLTPEGRVSRYLFGVTYSAKDLAAGLKAASGSQVGSPVQQLFLLCFHYNALTGKYSMTILGILRLMAMATILGLTWLFLVMVRRGKAAQARTLPGRCPPSSTS